MNDDMMFEYLLQMGAMRPEEIELMRKQKQIDALRGNAMEAPQGQMVGKHYVPPSFTQYASQLGQGYMAGQAQKAQKGAMDVFTQNQADELKKLRDRIAQQRMMRGMTGTGTYDPYSQFAMPSNT